MKLFFKLVNKAIGIYVKLSNWRLLIAICFMVASLLLVIVKAITIAVIFMSSGLFFIFIHYYYGPFSVFQDLFLKWGWYRWSLSIFTSDTFSVNGEPELPVHWIRVSLPSMRTTRKHKRISLANQNFKLNISKYECTPEVERLFYLYKQNVFPGHVDGYLKFDKRHNAFSSYGLEVRDGETLIGLGVFDLGATTVTTQLTVYHPDYTKYYLGKFISLQIARFAHSIGKKWLYPGYIIQGNPKMNYKLFYDRMATEIYLRKQNVWIPYSFLICYDWNFTEI